MRRFIFLFLLAYASQPLLAQSSDNIYDWTGEPTDDGLTRVKYKGRTGYINDKKREVIEVQYADASDFEDGLAQVSKDGKLYGMNEDRWELDTSIFRRPGEQGRLF